MTGLCRIPARRQHVGHFGLPVVLNWSIFFCLANRYGSIQIPEQRWHRKQQVAGKATVYGQGGGKRKSEAETCKKQEISKNKRDREFIYRVLLLSYRGLDFLGLEGLIPRTCSFHAARTSLGNTRRVKEQLAARCKASWCTSVSVCHRRRTKQPIGDAPWRRYSPGSWWGSCGLCSSGRPAWSGCLWRRRRLLTSRSLHSARRDDNNKGLTGAGRVKRTRDAGVINWSLLSRRLPKQKHMTEENTEPFVSSADNV